MTTSNPAPKTLSISTGDQISCGGNQYLVSNVSSADNGQGFVIYTVTLSGAGLPLNGQTVSCSYTNTAISSEAPKSIAGAKINASFWVVTGAH